MKVFIFLTLLAVQSLALPKNYEMVPKLKKSVASANVRNLGRLPTNHAVGLAADPADSNKLFFADETALYQFDKTTGQSTMIAGQESAGLLTMRSSVDGPTASFKYITKIVSRPTALYIFDFDRLRTYNYRTKEVSTLVTLSTTDNPVTGALSSDESVVYWTDVSNDDGHLVMKLSVGQDVGEAEVVTGGPTLVSHLEISADNDYLLLADVEMEVIERVKISDGDITFITRYGRNSFEPGAMAVNGNTLYAINRDAKAIFSYKVDETPSTSQSVCGSCEDEFSNPLDLTFDSASGNLYVLDGDAHPTLPTYRFSVKAICVSQAVSGSVGMQQDLSQLLQFYSGWLASANQD